MSYSTEYRRWFSVEEELRAFELEEFGTNRMDEIQEVIQKRNWQDAQERMTGMEEEQADWEDDPEIYSHNDAFGSAD